LLRESAEEAYNAGIAAELRTPSGTYLVPNVLRLIHYSKVPKLNATWSRKNVLRRDSYTCIYCGKSLEDGLKRQDFTMDHIIPKSQGGGNSWMNTACACHPCNNRKADRTPEQAGMKMRWLPKTPRTSYLIARGGPVEEEWKIYLEIDKDELP
jgi:5-methylcytosine-specific restriction endonuclease McrA